MASIYICGDNEKLNTEVKELLSGTNTISGINEQFEAVIETTVYNKEVKFNNLREAYKSNSKALVVSNSVCIPLLEQMQNCTIKNLTGVSLYPTFSAVKAIELSFIEGQSVNESISNIFTVAGKKVHTIIDRPGLAALRIISLIINEAYLVLQEGTSSKKDIDTAMKLGTNYPYGPIEWSERIGLDNIYHLIKKMHEYYGDDRYRVTPLLYENYQCSMINAQ